MHKPRQSHTRRAIQRASERGRLMARRRWQLDRERRDAIAAQDARDPLRSPGRILRRFIVIDQDQTAHEIIIREGDSTRFINRRLAPHGLVLKRTAPAA
jgi:predicted methyltransferase